MEGCNYWLFSQSVKCVFGFFVWFRKQPKNVNVIISMTYLFCLIEKSKRNTTENRYREEKTTSVVHFACKMYWKIDQTSKMCCNVTKEAKKKKKMHENNAAFKVHKNWLCRCCMGEKMHLIHLLDLRDTHAGLVSNNVCKHDFCLCTRKHHRAPLRDLGNWQKDNFGFAI